MPSIVFDHWSSPGSAFHLLCRDLASLKSATDHAQSRRICNVGFLRRIRNDRHVVQELHGSQGAVLTHSQVLSCWSSSSRYCLVQFKQLRQHQELRSEPRLMCLLPWNTRYASCILITVTCRSPNHQQWCHPLFQVPASQAVYVGCSNRSAICGSTIL